MQKGKGMEDTDTKKLRVQKGLVALNHRTVYYL